VLTLPAKSNSFTLGARVAKCFINLTGVLGPVRQCGANLGDLETRGLGDHVNDLTLLEVTLGVATRAKRGDNFSYVGSPDESSSTPRRTVTKDDLGMALASKGLVD